jgi:hypothetical protein
MQNAPADLDRRELNMEANQVYILFSCNEWKEYSSMRIASIHKNIQSLKKAIEEEVLNGNMEFDHIENLSSLDILRDINTRLSYGDVQLYDIQE